MNSIVSNVFRFASSGLQRVINTERHFHALPSAPAVYEVTPNPWSFDSVRTVVRNYFPKPRERKRVKIFGWRARLSTKNGRRLVMRRILKGRWYLTH